MTSQASAEWVQIWANNLFLYARKQNLVGPLARMVSKMPELKRFLGEYQKLIGFS
jgi:hypothetical protein